MLDYADDLRKTVSRVATLLAGVPEEAAARRPAPGKWSAKEIIGHLVDSASNNHQRFVRAQFQDDLVFPGYAQDEWVAVQRYQEAPWPHLLTLWRDFNLHLARVIEATPAERAPARTASAQPARARVSDACQWTVPRPWTLSCVTTSLTCIIIRQMQIWVLSE